MALVTLNSLLASIHGRYGEIVFVYRRGRQHVRPYVKPRNPDTPKQRNGRVAFGAAVREWQSLPDEEKRTWSRRAGNLPLSGYNLFISRYLLGRKKRTVSRRPGDGVPMMLEAAWMPCVRPGDGEAEGSNYDTICVPIPSLLLRTPLTPASYSPLYGMPPAVDADDTAPYG